LEPERKTLLLAANLNLAMCYLKVDNFTSARGKCEDALEVDPNSVKALFRRGQVRTGNFLFITVTYHIYHKSYL
jgi:FK506-binding protein 4/5